MPKTYPWSGDYPFIRFSFNATHLPKPCWAVLGECASKIEHVLGTPLRKDVADQLNSVFIAKGAHATTAIEGNTLSEEQVRKRVDGERSLPPTQEYLGREVDNIVTAYNMLVEQLVSGVQFHLSPDDLRKLNRLVLEGLEVEKGVVPGQYRDGRVGVADYLSPPREHVEEMLQLGCNWLNETEWSQEIAGGSFIGAILRAVFAHLYIAWIHPFGDGNGRTARLVEFDLLIRAGVPIACAHLLSDHYNRTRSKYYRALSAARQDVNHFVCYAVEGMRDLLREQIDMIREQQMEVTWQNYIYSTFRDGEDSVTTKRQREVALALGMTKAIVPIDAIHLLTPKLAQFYSNRTTRTLHRDISTLKQMGIVKGMPKGGIKANLDLVKAFLPAKGAARTEAGDMAKASY